MAGVCVRMISVSATREETVWWRSSAERFCRLSQRTLSSWPEGICLETLCATCTTAWGNGLISAWSTRRSEFALPCCLLLFLVFFLCVLLKSLNSSYIFPTLLLSRKAEDNHCEILMLFYLCSRNINEHSIKIARICFCRNKSKPYKIRHSKSSLWFSKLNM